MFAVLVALVLLLSIFTLHRRAWEKTQKNYIAKPETRRRRKSARSDALAHGSCLQQQQQQWCGEQSYWPVFQAAVKFSGVRLHYALRPLRFRLLGRTISLPKVVGWVVSCDFDDDVV